MEDANPRTQHAPPIVRAVVGRALELMGPKLAAHHAGICERAMLKAAAGLPVSRGSLAILREYCRAVGADPDADL